MRCMVTETKKTKKIKVDAENGQCWELPVFV